MANIISVILSNAVPGQKRAEAVKPQLFIFKVDGIPSTGLGTAAPLGTTSIYEDGVTATRYFKFGVSDTDWVVEMPVTSQPFLQTTPSDWTTDPQTIQEALDELAAETYTPSVATDWATPPTTVQEGLDQIVANGAGHFQKARDPLLTPAPTIYVRSAADSPAGNDDTGDGTITAPFLTIARAYQSVPSFVEATSGPSINVGAGVFVLPWTSDQNAYTISGVTATLVSTYAVDATTPVNSRASGNRFVLDTLDLAATVPPGTPVNFVTTTTPGTANVKGIVYRSDNSGAGGKLVIWVASTVSTVLLNVAVGASVQVNTYTTTLNLPRTSCYLFSKGISRCNITGVSNSILFCSNVLFTDVWVTGVIISPIANGLTIGRAYTNRIITSSSSQSTALGIISLTLGVVVKPEAGVLAGVSTSAAQPVRLNGEVVFVGASVGGLVLGGGVANAQSTNVPVLRAVGGTGPLLFVGVTSGTIVNPDGGNFSIGDCHTVQDIAGVEIAGSIIGNYVVNVSANKAAVVTLGTGSAVTLGGVLNPVAINGAAKSADASGTYILGGSPKPGANGASTQYVSANADTWDGISRTVVCTTATMGAGIFNMPAIAVGVGITDSASVTIINEDGVAAVVVTPSGTELINGVNATMGVGGIGTKGKLNLTVRASINNYMVS